MEPGLAHQMTYGEGSGQTITHHYAGAMQPKKRKNKGKGKKKVCKK